MESTNRPGIYRIINTVNGKIYIGSAVKLSRRKYIHFLRLTKGDHCNIKLQNAFVKYGAKSLSFEVIEFVDDKDKLIEREQHYIDFFKPYKKKIGYNISPTAGSTLGVPAWNKGITHSDATKEKLRLANVGKKIPKEVVEKCKATKLLRGTNRHTEESKRKISQGRIGADNPFFGKKHSDDARKRIAENLTGSKNPFFGKRHSDEIMQRISSKLKGRVLSPEWRAKLSASGKGRKQSKEHIEKRIAKRILTVQMKKAS